MVSFRGLVVASVAIPVGITIWDVLVGFSSVRSQTKESLAEWAFANNPSTIASVVKPWKFPSIAVTTPNNSAMDHHLYTPSMFVESNVLPFYSRLVGQTVCHKDGRFRDTAADAWNASSTTLVHEWELKLIYLAVHALHHQPALQEHRERLQCMEDTDTTTATLIKQHSYQYECQNAKFLVTDLVNQGMGAAIRLSGVAHVLMGIASDRIPLLVANAPQGPSFLQQPWKLASCPRNDLQCVFLPTSPCTLSIEELANATVLDELSARSLRRGGSLPKQYQNDKVLIYQARVAPAKFDQFRGIHNAVRKRIYLEAIELVKEWKTANPHNTEQLGVLQQAAQRIQKGDSADSYNHYEYGHRYYRIAHAILLYLLRPNLHSQQDIKAQLEAIVPTSLDPHNALGMPIRGSDKCHKESTCLPFHKYMKLAKETFVEKHTFQKEQRGHLIVTTEDESVFQQRLLFNNVTGFPLDFVVNHKDTLQGSGNAQSFGDNADDIMKSSLIALQLQFHAGHVYGNCCSNFHLVLFDFLREGCGLTQTTTCLQETSNYNICCQWTRTEECEAIRAEQQEQQPDNGARQKLLSRLQLHEQAKQQLMANHTNATTMNSVFLLSTK